MDGDSIRRPQARGKAVSSTSIRNWRRVVDSAGTLGLGGFSNGEAQKAGAPYPRLRLQRYILRQTFGLGGGQETVEAGPSQVAGKRDVDRVTITVGRFADWRFF